jgi:hypothetical protein
MPTGKHRVRAALRAAVSGAATGPSAPMSMFPAGSEHESVSPYDAPAMAGGDEWSVVEAGGTEYQEPKALLREANVFFNEMGKAEKRRFREAHAKIKEMKAVNAKGGDKDGFKFVIPKSVKSMARQLDPNSGDGLPELRSTFVEEAAVEVPPESHTDKPMKRKKRAGHVSKDFYQVQVWKRWTQNAEKFLSRGRASSKLFEAQGKTNPNQRRGPAQRNAIKKL